MDHHAGLLSLPVELLQHIGSFLAVKDILACSASCQYLRMAFNDNTIWKAFLSDKYLTSLQLVSKCFEPEYCLEEALTPLCENRVAFMQKTNLINNWRFGNFEKRCSNILVTIVKEANRRRFERLAVYKEHYLFFGQFFNNAMSDTIELWDIRKIPTIVTELNLEERYYKFYVIADSLVVIKCMQAKVFKIDLSAEALIFEYSFLIEDSEAVFDERPISAWQHDHRCVWDYTNVDQYLFANKHQPKPSPCVFHIWDIANACKIGSFFTPMPGFGLRYHSSLNGTSWMLQIYKKSHINNNFFSFDVKKKMFSEKVLVISNIVFHSLVYETYLVSFEISGHSDRASTMVRVYDLKTSEAVNQRCLQGSSNTEIIRAKIVNDTFVILYEEYFCVLHARTLDTLQVIPCRGVAYTKEQVNICGSLFIFAVNTEDKLEVWDVSKKSKIWGEIRGQAFRRLYLNKSCTKVVRYSDCKIEVFHFL